MTVNQKKEALQNALISFEFPKKYIIQTADKRIGVKFAIAVETYHGGIDCKTDFMTYEEFNMYLKGYYHGTMNKFCE